MRLVFEVPGTPVGKSSIRILPLLWCDKCQKQTVRRQCRCGNTQLTYRSSFPTTEAKTKDYMALVRQFADTAMREQGVTMMFGPLRLTIRIYVQMPESRACKKHADWKGPFPHPSGPCKKVHEGDWGDRKPDCSNVLKGIEDAVNTVVFPDDKAICEEHLYKYWSSRPRCEVEVETL